MERGKLNIESKTNTHQTIIFEPANGTVWMNKNELCELFAIYLRQLNGCLDDIFKTNTFHIEEVCMYHRIVKNNKICYDITDVNLDIIIALAFRLESSNARVLRDWFMTKVVKPENNYTSLADIHSYSLN